MSMASSGRHLLLLFGTILLVQSSMGKSLPLDETTTVLETVDVATRQPIIPEIPGKDFYYYILSEFNKVANSTLKIGKKLLEDVIAEISARDEKSEDITERLELFSEIATEIDKFYSEYGVDFSDIFINFELVEHLINLLGHAKITTTDEPTETDKLFAKALENNGLSYFEKIFKEKFSEVFSNKFYTEANRILNSPEEWFEKRDAREWLEILNAESNVNQKFGDFTEFYHFYPGVGMIPYVEE